MLRFSLPLDKDLDIKDLQIALINYIISKKEKSNFLIIIQDINSLEINKEQESIDILKKFAINCENKIYQSKNISIYQRFAKKLIEDKKAYICFCKDENNSCIKNCANLTTNEIEKKLKDKQKYSIRVKKPEVSIEFEDIINAKTVIHANRLNDFIIIDKNFKPTNSFASAIDDMTFAITTVITNEDNTINSAKQIYIRKLLNYTQDIKYAHLPRILNSNNADLSLKWFIKEGYIPDSIINYILSFGYKTSEEIFYLPDTIKWYDLSNISKTESSFNIDKLRYFNRIHLLNMDNKKLSSIFGFADNDIGKLLKLYLEDVSTINELEVKFKLLFSKKECKEEFTEIMQTLSKIILKAPIINSYNEFIDYLVKESGLNKIDIIKPLSLLLVGVDNINNLNKIYPLIKSYILEIVRCK